MWISIEDELPMCLALDLLQGGTDIKVKHPTRVKAGLKY